jgi:predicted DNA binding CopG/RHH family protein
MGAEASAANAGCQGFSGKGLTGARRVRHIARMVKKKTLVKINTQLPEELLAHLRGYVAEHGAKMQTVFAEAIRQFLAARR